MVQRAYPPISMKGRTRRNCAERSFRPCGRGILVGVRGLSTFPSPARLKGGRRVNSRLDRLFPGTLHLFQRFQLNGSKD